MTMGRDLAADARVRLLLVEPREGYRPPTPADPARLAAVAANESLVFRPAP